MSKELVISADRHETRVALLEDDQLVEVHFQRSNEYSLAGSIHKGKVTRVLPGMQSAFVDVGLERDTFLYVSDFLEEHEDIDEVTSDEKPLSNSPGRRGRRRRGSRRMSGEKDRRDEKEASAESGDSDEDSGEERRPRRNGRANAAASANAAAKDGDEDGKKEVRSGSEDSAEEVEASAESDADEGVSTDGEGRRRRRSRRRRGGRSRSSIPDSKYAEVEAKPSAKEKEEKEEEPRESGNRERSRDIAMVLPGESLAKYRSKPTAAEAATKAPKKKGSKSAGDEDAEDVTEEILDQVEAQVTDEVRPPALRAPAKETGSDAEDPDDAASDGKSAKTKRGGKAKDEAKKADADDEEDTEEVDVAVEQDSFNEAIHKPTDNAEPDAPEHPLPAEGVASEEEDAEFEIEEEDSADEDSDEEDADEDDDSGPASYLDEDEDEDIKAMILGAAGLDDDDEDEEDSDDEDEDDESGEEEDSAEESDEEDSDAEESDEESDEDEDNQGKAESGEQSSAEGEEVEAGAKTAGGRYPGRTRRRRRRRKPETAAGESGEKSAASSAEGEGGNQTEASDVEEESEDKNKDHKGEKGGRIRRSRTNHQSRSQPTISEMLKQGQEIIVQIAKEPLGQKGARITSHVALPGRFVVYMPTLQHMGVSRKIGSEEERHRLKKVLQGNKPGEVGGFITRTAAEGRTEEEIAADMKFLYDLWQEIRAKADKGPAPKLLHHDLDIVQRVLRDQLADDFKAIWIDNEELFEQTLKFVERFQPSLVGKVKLYTREVPIFDAFGVTQEMEKALRPKVWLKSGGYIVINQTEALVAIDVNTGKYVGKSNRLEDTIVKTNTEAIKEIVRQVRLRDLGGIIVIDFIDMDERKNRQKVMQALEEAMKVDRAPYKILQFNDFGLVAITRKRVKQSLERTLCSPCPHCEGAGYIKSTQSVVSEILTEARKMASSVEGKDVLLRVHPDVAKVIKSHKNKYLEELEEILRRPVLVKSDALLHHEKFDLA